LINVKIQLLMTFLSNPFAPFFTGLAKFLEYLMGIVIMVTLVVTFIHVMNGDREAALKVAKWFAVSVIGFLLLSVFVNVLD